MRSGRACYAAVLKPDCELGARLRARLRAGGWLLANDTPLPVVCFRDAAEPADGAPIEAVGRRGAESPCAFTLLVPRPCQGLHRVVDPEDHGWREARAVLGHFAEDDQWESADEVRSLEEELRSAGRQVSFNVYPGAAHWFAEADRPDAYEPEAASLAFDRTVAFLNSQLAAFATAE